MKYVKYLQYIDGGFVLIKFIIEEDKAEIRIQGESDEILAELENACCFILNEVCQKLECDPEKLTSFFAENLCKRSKTHFLYADTELN